MSALLDGGKAERAGELRGKSLQELTEILERQEKLLSNKKFITKLPDRGKKILDYHEKVQFAITELNRRKETSDLLSSFKIQFQEQQCNGSRNAETTEQSEVSPTMTQGKESSSDCANTFGTKFADDPNTSSSPTFVKIDKETCSNASRTDEKLADVLANSMQMISIKESDGNANKDLEAASLYERTIMRPGTDGVKKSHCIEVIERRSMSPIQRKDRFRTNRLPSDSNSSTPDQSPGDKALKMSAEQRKLHDRKHLDDITAARLPPLHHSPAQLLPLEESLSLQIVQKNIYEEKQAKLAAQKLFEKLNIKMGPYNPEGDSYMKYRDHKDDDQFGAGE